MVREKDPHVSVYLDEVENKIYCLYSDNKKKKTKYYVIIFKNLKNECRLITAYPVTIISDIHKIRNYKCIEKTGSAERNP